jgi:hypothetical protein
MENNKKEVIFINGLISKEVPETAPDFILGNISIEVNNLINWLMEARTKDYCKNGWINAQIKRGSSGKRYIAVDTWQPSPRDGASPSPSTNEGQGMVDVEREFKNGEVNPADIPF